MTSISTVLFKEIAFLIIFSNFLGLSACIPIAPYESANLIKLGFFNKVAAFLGPTIYFFMAVIYDSRAGIFSIAFLLLLGAILLYRVDIEAGIEDAKAEDIRVRKMFEESENITEE